MGTVRVADLPDSRSHVGLHQPGGVRRREKGRVHWRLDPLAGQNVNLYDLQYQYMSTDGVDFAIFSLTRLRELGPDLICPSHGEPFGNPAEGMTDLIHKMKGWVESYAPGTALTVENKSVADTPHLVASDQTTSSFYALISDSGKALLVDYGSASSNFFNGFNDAAPVLDRMRSVEHTIPQLKARYRLKSVDVAMPSHMHADHLNGFPRLARRYGTKIWCYENMVDILQNPRGNNLGCIPAEPIRVDRAFRNGENSNGRSLNSRSSIRRGTLNTRWPCLPRSTAREWPSPAMRSGRLLPPRLTSSATTSFSATGWRTTVICGR